MSRWLQPLSAVLMLLAGSASGGVLNPLVQFQTCPDDTVVLEGLGAALAADSAGNIYGTTYAGGQYGKGQIYKFSKNGVFSIIHSFGKTPTDGSGPAAGLISGPNGFFYGTTRTGGDHLNNGTVFKVAPSGVVTTLHSFGSQMINGNIIDGTDPVAGVTVGPDGALYGVTKVGGSNGYGEIYRLTADGHSFTPLYSFKNDSSDGANPDTSLTLGLDGNFYGTLRAGGDYAVGSVYQLVVTNGAFHSFTRIHSFGASASDANTPSSLTLGPDGRLYGTSSAGGQIGGGTIFRLSCGTADTVAVLYSFPSPINATGSQPLAPLTLGWDWNFYGTDAFGGTNGAGEIFQYNPWDGGTGFQSLYPFAGGTDGYAPQAPVLLAPDGNFYGTTSQAGSFNVGTLYQWTAGLTHSFSLAAGVYQGLFGATPSDISSPIPSDFITLIMGASGDFSGKILMAGVRYNLAGKFNSNGGYAGNVAPASAGAPTIFVALQTDPRPNRQQPVKLGNYAISGVIAGQQFFANHAAYQLGDATAEAGTYTVKLAPSTTNLNGLFPAPKGYGHATVTVNHKGGGVKIAGKLANGDSFSYSGVLVGGMPYNQFIVYDDTTQLAHHLYGILSFRPQPGSDLDGSLAWIENPSSSPNYPNGISTTLAAKGMHYTPPKPGVRALALPNGGAINIGDPNAFLTLEMLTLSTQNKITITTNPNKDTAKVTIKASSGEFTGSFVNNLHKTISFEGILYQDPLAPEAYGFCLDQGLSWPVTITP